MKTLKRYINAEELQKYNWNSDYDTIVFFREGAGYPTVAGVFDLEDNTDFLEWVFENYDRTERAHAYVELHEMKTFDEDENND